MSSDAGGPFYEIDGLRPVVDPEAFVHPTAAVVGDVLIGPGVYVGPYASLRGDFGRIVLGRGSNIQDCCVCHAFPGEALEVGEDGHIGHSSVLHGCRIERNAMVGIAAVILDGAVIGESAVVGAKALVTAGFQVPPRSLAIGIPAKVVRKLDDGEIAWKEAGTRSYQRLVVRSRSTMRPCKPLTAPEPGRKRIEEIHPEEMETVPKQSAAGSRKDGA